MHVIVWNAFAFKLLIMGLFYLAPELQASAQLANYLKSLYPLAMKEPKKYFFFSYVVIGFLGY